MYTIENTSLGEHGIWRPKHHSLLTTSNNVMHNRSTWMVFKILVVSNKCFFVRPFTIACVYVLYLTSCLNSLYFSWYYRLVYEVCGRMADVLTNMGFQTGSFSISGENFLLSGVSLLYHYNIILMNISITVIRSLHPFSLLLQLYQSLSIS